MVNNIHIFNNINKLVCIFPCRVTEALFSLVQRGTNTAVVAMSTINNLALEQGYDIPQNLKI